MLTKQLSHKMVALTKKVHMSSQSSPPNLPNDLILEPTADEINWILDPSSDSPLDFLSEYKDEAASICITGSSVHSDEIQDAKQEYPSKRKSRNKFRMRSYRTNGSKIDSGMHIHADWAYADQIIKKKSSEDTTILEIGSHVYAAYPGKYPLEEGMLYSSLL